MATVVSVPQAATGDVLVPEIAAIPAGPEPFVLDVPATPYLKRLVLHEGLLVGTGWLPPVPDMRDYTIESSPVLETVEKIGLKGGAPAAALPAKVDLRAWCSPIENQLNLGSCTANAAVGMVEYFERRAFNKYLDGSRLFVYKTTRDLLGVTGDTGAWLRNTMGALVLFGVPPEKYWPYNVATFDNEPSAFLYSVADDYETLKYFCHDPIGKNVAPADVLASVKTYVAAGIPSMFGFYGFPSFGATSVKGGIPYPCPGERAQWGHAIVAVGYDDGLKIDNTRCKTSTTGALLIRNSWGTTWGDGGYGWLPYQYALDRLALDFWSMFAMNWADTGAFGV